MIGWQGRLVVRARVRAMPGRAGSDRVDRNEVNRSGDVPLHAGSNQVALLESETQARWWRCGSDRLQKQVLRISGESRQIKSRRKRRGKLKELHGNDELGAPVGKSGILCLAAGAGRVEGRLFFGGSGTRTTGVDRFFTGRGRLRKTTAQRVRDENREKQCGNVAKKTHRSTVRDRNDPLTVQS
jgi:hypothetical protein